MLDLFGDEDTLALAEAHLPLPGRFGGGRTHETAVRAGLDALAARAGSGLVGLVLGSGFEGAPALMQALAARHRLIGAAPDTVAQLKDPAAFAALCARLSIPHPAVTTRAVPDPEDWLLKRVGGSGGSHVRRAGAGDAPPGHYLQRRVSGRPHALNVLADGRDAVPLALTRQWTAPSPLRPFRYAGAIAPARGDAIGVPPGVAAAILAAVARLVAETGLRGLASADVLVDGDAWHLLEINPRPGATLDVLDRRAHPLLDAHLEASLGRLPTLDAPPVDAAGAEICYAASRIPAMPPVDWPGYARDRPGRGSCVARDAPLCTVVATAPDAATVKETLRSRMRDLRALLDDTEDTHGRARLSEHQRADEAAGGPSRR